MKRTDPVYVQLSRKILVHHTPPSSPWLTPIMLVLLILLTFAIGLVWIALTEKAINPYKPYRDTTESNCTTDQDCAEKFPTDQCAGAPARPGDHCDA